MSEPNGKQILRLDPMFSNKVRLAIIVNLVGSEDPVEFNTLLEALELTKGNLSSHMKKMEEADFITQHKEFIDRKPRTTYSLTDHGRSELRSYLDTLSKLLEIKF